MFKKFNEKENVSGVTQLKSSGKKLKKWGVADPNKCGRPIRISVVGGSE